VETGREVAEFAASRGFVRALAFSPDGRRLATVSGTGSVQLWDSRPLDDQRRALREALAALPVGGERAAPGAGPRPRVAEDPSLSDAARARAQDLALAVWSDRAALNAEAIEREARAVVIPLFRGLRLPSRVAEAIRADRSLRAALREEALKQAASWDGSV